MSSSRRAVQSLRSTAPRAGRSRGGQYGARRTSCDRSRAWTSFPILLLVANLLVSASVPDGRPERLDQRRTAAAADPPRKHRIVGTDRDASAALGTRTTEEVRDPPLTCAAWGSFPSQVVAAETRLAPLELGARLSRSESAGAGSYLVIIPPIERRVDLDLRLEELNRASITDRFVINDSELRNGISLDFSRARMQRIATSPT